MELRDKDIKLIRDTTIDEVFKVIDECVVNPNAEYSERYLYAERFKQKLRELWN